MAPTETEDGYILYTCSRCLEEKKEILPATGPTDPAPTDPTPTDPTPTPTDDGRKRRREDRQ